MFQFQAASFPFGSIEGRLAAPPLELDAAVLASHDESWRQELARRAGP